MVKKKNKMKVFMRRLHNTYFFLVEKFSNDYLYYDWSKQQQQHFCKMQIKKK